MTKLIKITDVSDADRELLANIDAYAKEMGIKPVQAARSLITQALAAHVGRKEIKSFLTQPKGGK